jgi:putative molybdopterin biosynthesis protein
MTKRQVYINPKPYLEALELWRERLASAGLWAPLQGELIKTDDALGRVTAEAVEATVSSPFFHASAMDGVAVRFADTLGASESSPKRLKLGEQAVFVNTGHPLPAGMDAVIMIEDIEEPGDGTVEIIEAATPWQHIRPVGEDIVATELIVSENHLLRPMDIAAVLAGGITRLSVRRRPRVSFIPTGSELVPPGTDMKRGDIVEYNSRMLAGMAVQWGAEVRRHDIVKDDLGLLKAAITEEARWADLVVVNAGSSAGTEDYTIHAIAGLGEVIQHGVSIRPGKPTIFGMVDGKAVLGVPGYPVSAHVSFRLFGGPLVYALQGREQECPRTITAKLSRQLSSPIGVEEFVNVKLGKVGEGVIATPISRGAGVLMSIVRADGVLRIPSGLEGFAAGSDVEAELFRPLEDIEKSVVCIGSHDNTLDLLANFLKKRHPEYGLSSAHVGSLGGVIALRKGEAHIAGSHLLDEATGEYNIPIVKKHLAGRKAYIINLVHRQQGLLVKKGNPKGIAGLPDLTRDDVVFVNRQPGSGTRLLTDLCLSRAGIDPLQVKGYEHDEYTHMGVASAVLSDAADAGMAILAAANALGTDFVPVASERYDLVIPAEHIGHPAVEAMLDIVRNDAEFKKAVEGLGGYDTSEMGKVVWEG